ncbi:hypothetical protein [Solemya elarraichensis gill symbiont]|uniref:Uncharacterized protein n=1 Tax=Solemya elarraichensis gill symbiont TaxID=1918949 RepID=A0A1T2L063_9GAMM|nr:hypothetical protein [Solemya elarraichensis gill symbiont]OOZ38493.1 hypothetical protein BOW52_08445 [Solemya elarraichensis gill symbiont]
MVKSNAIYLKTTMQLVTEADTHDIPGTIIQMREGNLDMELFLVRQWAVKQKLIGLDTDIGAFG